jgi:hypothetical protein
MIKKIELIELIRHRLEGEPRTKHLGKVHPEIIAFNIGLTYKSLVSQILQKRTVDPDPFIKEYTDVSVSLDATTGDYYSTLPANIIMLPRRAASGVISVRPNDDTAIEYVPITNGQLKVSDGLEVNLVDDVVGYTYKNNRVEYQGMTATIAANDVRMELVIPFEDMADTDEVNIPTGYDDALFGMVVNKMLGLPDSDNLNNNNSFNPNKRQ